MTPKKNLTGFHIPAGFKKKLSPSFMPATMKPVAPAQQPQAVAAVTKPQQPTKHVHLEMNPRVPLQNESLEVTLTKEEYFCAVMDILLDGMARTDKASKDAAKHLMIVMENEAGHSVSLLVFNSYVRRYNSLRQQFFLSATENIKAKTIKISSDILASLEQMAKTIKIEMSLPVNIPRRTS